jgi:hypothetical protein
MESWRTLKSKIIEVGGDNFIEVTLKQPPEGENRLIGISKGWYTEDRQKRYKSNILFDVKKKDEIIDAIEEMSQ